VRSRLARGRSELRRRITRRGLVLSAAAFEGTLRPSYSSAAGSYLSASLVESLTRAAGDAVQCRPISISTTLTAVLEGVLNVSRFKKIAFVSGAISIGAATMAIVERSTAGQTQESALGTVEAPQGVLHGRIESTAASPSKADSRDATIDSKLNEKVSTNILQQPLSGAVSSLQDYTGVNIVLDPKALREQGVTSSTPVSLTVKQVPLKSVLKLLLKPLGLTYKVEDHVVLITSPQVTDLTTYTKTYYVGDLVPPWVPPALMESSRPPVTADKRTLEITPLMDLIQMTVAPGTWAVQEGVRNPRSSDGEANPRTSTTHRNSMVPFLLSVSLIIKATPDVHRDIANLFRGLRRCQFGANSKDRPWLAERRTATTGGGAEANPQSPSTGNSKKKIDELLKALRDEIQKLDTAPPGTYSIPLER
jgi:hypothetical protein